MIWILGFIIGTVLGSFAKVIADRSLVKQSFWGRSYCPHCKKQLRWYDLFPILSFLILRGRCRHCRKKISLHYPLTEIILGLIIAVLFSQVVPQFTDFTDSFKLTLNLMGLIFSIFAVVVLYIVALTDIKKMLIPDLVILPSIMIGLIALLVIYLAKIGYLYYILYNNPLGRYILSPNNPYFTRHVLQTVEPFIWSIAAGLGIGLFFTLLIIITRGRGMGGGDVKLGAFIGLTLGFPNSVVALMLAFLTGAVVSIFLVLLKRKHFGQTIPFGPFLVLGSYIALFWGKEIVNWYLGLAI